MLFLKKKKKFNPTKVGSDSDSEWSSLERRERDPYNRGNRKPTPHKKVRRKRGIPVAPPRLPSFEGNSNNFSNKVTNSAKNAPKLAGDSPLDVFEQTTGTESLNYYSFVKRYERNNRSNGWLSLSPSCAAQLSKGRANTPSDGSEFSNEDNEPVDENQATASSKTRPKRSFHLRRRAKPPTQSHSIPETNYGESNSPPISSVENNHNNVSPFSIEHSRKSYRSSIL